MDHPFSQVPPSAALTGRIVLDYLEKTSAENGLRQRELQEKLEAAQEECRQLTARTDGAGGAAGHPPPGHGTI